LNAPCIDKVQIVGMTPSHHNCIHEKILRDLNSRILPIIQLNPLCLPVCFWKTWCPFLSFRTAAIMVYPGRCRISTRKSCHVWGGRGKGGGMIWDNGTQNYNSASFMWVWNMVSHWLCFMTEVKWGWKKLHYNELHDLYSSPDIIGVTK